MILKKDSGPSHWGWALLLLVFCTAAVSRLWQLDIIPPGLYRDEAFNGLDALGVWEGNHALFFTRNNGREPAYIYLTALFVGLFGRTVTAVRLAAAITGTLTTLFVYLLGREWFGKRTGLFAAWLWAVTLWAVHLSRVGLRPILLVPCLTLTFWLGTLAYRRQQKRWWLLAGAVYGLSFYTYLAVRFTPLLLALVLLYLLWQRGWRSLWPGLLWFGASTAVMLLPLIFLYSQQPDLLLGRAGQVSIFNETIHHGDLLGTLLKHIGHSLGLFLWQGDTILRHNPGGRPLFDPFLAVPFLLGLFFCVRKWRQPAAMITLLWLGVMLWVTILAEDAPHFLRVVGILPAAMFLPAVGLNKLWEWQKVPIIMRQGVVISALILSLMLTIRDYAQYGRDVDVGYLFETAAVDLAQQLKAEQPNTAVYMDDWFWDDPTQGGWPSIPFLADLSNVMGYRPEFGVLPAASGQPISIYAWQFGDLAFVPQLIQPPALVTIQEGTWAKGDLEETPYPLYVYFHAEPTAPAQPLTLNFADQIRLHNPTFTIEAEQTIVVDLYWEANTAVDANLVSFLHITGPTGLITQLDLPPGGVHWLPNWWQEGLIIHEQRTIILPQPFDPTQHQVMVGLYNQVAAARLPILDKQGNSEADQWQVSSAP